MAAAFLVSVSTDAAERCGGYAVQGARAAAVPLGLSADVDGDGVPDVVTGNRVQFGTGSTVWTGVYSAVARRSRKGPSDLLRISQVRGLAVWLDALRVTPDGAIAVRSTPLAGPTIILAVGDFNGDGIDDVVLRDQIRFGTPDGTFAPGPALPLVIPEGLTADVAVGDFDGDHHLDLAIHPRWTDETGPFKEPPLTIYSGDGNGNVHASRTIANLYYSGPAAFVVADVDGDGLDDLILNDWLGIDIIRSRPGSAPQHIDAMYVEGLITGDFNGDGKPDIAAVTQAVSYEAKNDLHVWLNDGNGRLQHVWQTKVAPLPTLSGGVLNSFIFARDVDGDGKDDIVLPQGAVLHSRGDGSFTGLPALAAGRLGAGVSGDFDGDGDDDVAFIVNEDLSGQSPSYKTVVFWNDGNGVFHTTTSPDPLASSFKVADVDGDGRAEILQWGTGNSVSVMRITPDGAVTKVAGVGDPAARRGLGFTTGHFTGSGTEIAIIDGAAGSPTQLHVAIYDVHEPSTPRRSVSIPGTLANTLAIEVASSDLNGDGRDDLILLGEGLTFGLHDYSPSVDGYAVALLSTGESYTLTTLYQSPWAMGALVAGDFNGDGIGDVAFMDGGYRPNVTFLYGDRHAHAHAEVFPIDPLTTPALTVSDLDGDGTDDLVITNRDTMELLFGGRTGAGRLQTYVATGDMTKVFAVRPHRGGVPWLFGSGYYPGALLWSPECERIRSARH